MMRRVVTVVAFVVGWGPLWTGPAQGNQSLPVQASTSVQAKDKAGVDLPIKGRYRIESIERVGKVEPYYRIIFTELDPAASRPAIKLALETYHVHVALGEGMELKLQAEISPQTPSASQQPLSAVHEADQILVYVTRPQGEVPVWMVSRHNKKLKLKGTSYLKMHDPQSDFLIF